ncbi:MAG: SAM-dependent methyltransferase [Chloroflexota bacterium]|nr:SAM-dependent methyltransferase [Chloroflexota bacterium]MDQ5864461.1 SAM-dependent methyltransferase [Chloroflexota bacterium]
MRLTDKPEVRKAGGVYYTPQFIVEHIVAQTVGGVLEGKTPKEISRLRVLDRACGSGSFLVGAYRHILEWHRRWYLAEGVRKHKGELYQDVYGDWQLTTRERKRTC